MAKRDPALGLARPVVSYAGGVLQLALPLPRVPAAGDAVSVRRGCPGTWDACKGFGNDQRFGGFPFVAPPESVR